MTKKKIFNYLLLATVVFLLFYFLLPTLIGSSYQSIDTKNIEKPEIQEGDINYTENVIEEKKVHEVTHIPTPEVVKGLYMSSWVAGTTGMRNNIIDIADTTEINTLIVDIKDSTGKISFEVSDPILKKENSVEKRIPDIYAFIDLLHSKDIYVIGRIAVFQDPEFIKNHPDDAVKKNTDKTSVWKDRNGLAWIDASSQDAREYILALAKESYSIGFDEINFDYIRYPSDGNMKDIYYPISEGMVKKDVMKSFYQFLNENLKPEGIPISADLFGMTATNSDDLGIGQILEDALVYFDFVAPMVYPSHFPPNWNGYAKPATKPYEVIHFSMAKAVERAEQIGESPLKLRPWLQDFNLGATYTKEMVRAQIDATYDVGLNSWLLWDAANTYTKSALEIK